MKLEDFEKHLRNEGCYYYRANITVHYYKDEKTDKGLFYGNYKGEETEDFHNLQAMMDAHSWVEVPENIMDESFPMARGLPEIHTYKLEWQGIPVTILYKPKYLTVMAHIEVRAEQPIPITETGYRSIFITEEEVEECGSAVDLVKALLDESAASNDWKVYAEASRQESLF